MKVNKVIGCSLPLCIGDKGLHCSPEGEGPCPPLKRESQQISLAHDCSSPTSELVQTAACHIRSGRESSPGDSCISPSVRRYIWSWSERPPIKWRVGQYRTRRQAPHLWSCAPFATLSLPSGAWRWAGSGQGRKCDPRSQPHKRRLRAGMVVAAKESLFWRQSAGPAGREDQLLFRRRISARTD